MMGYVFIVMWSQPLLIVAQIRSHLVQMLSRKNKSLSDIVQTLQEYHDNIDEDDSSDAESGGHGTLQQSILQNLMEFLKSC
jgi:beta-catenin-like protein 1